MEEQELAESCKQGDRLAFKELYERYAGRMLGVCLRYAAIGTQPKTCCTMAS